MSPHHERVLLGALTQTLAERVAVSEAVQHHQPIFERGNAGAAITEFEAAFDELAKRIGLKTK